MMNEKSKSIFSKVPKVLYENRYCNQEEFSILACEGSFKNEDMTNKILEFKIPSFKVKKFSSTVKMHYLYYLYNYKI